MIKKIIKDTERGIEINSSSEKTHWAWHLLLVASYALILIAFIFNDAFVERWFSSDHHITDAGKKYLAFMRYGLLVIAGALFVLWTMRRKITNYFKVAVKRWEESPSHIEISSVVPPLNPTVFRTALSLILLLWTVFVIISLIPGYDTWAARLTVENGVTETLTVIFYFFAAVMALTSAASSLRRNPRNVFLHLWLFCIAAACLFVALEETNWGDLYLHYKSGEFIRTINYQHDVSLHNIELPFVGQYWENKLLQILAICGGILLPLIIRYSRPFRRILWAIEFPVPPWLSQAYFFVSALIPQDKVMKVMHLQRANMPSELREVTISFGFAIWLWAASRSKLHQYPKKIN